MKLLLALLLAACGGPSVATAGLAIEDAWARPVHVETHPATTDPHAGHAGSNGAVYLSLRNTGPDADRLVRVESTVARAVEIHRTEVEGGIMRMRPVEDGVAIRGRETIEFRPGGLHLMLIGVNRSLRPGTRVPVVLHFEQAGPREVEAEVREP